MFELDYRIVHSEYDDFAGQNGFLQIKCNGFTYGDMYSRDIETVMEKVSLYDWFERLIRTAKNLMTNDYVALSDVESYNTWIEFKKIKNAVSVSVIKAEKEQGSHDIEFSLKDIQFWEWKEQIIDFEQFKREVIQNAREYLKSIIEYNTDNVLLKKLEKEIEELQTL